MMMNKNSKIIMDELDKLYPNPKCFLNYTKDYELLIAVMLSAQSTDKRVNIVTKELFKYSIDELASMDVKKIEDIIRPVGTYHKKAEFIKGITNSLIKNYGGKVPYDREYVESLPGVGHKTCNVVFSEIFGEPNIPVDTHVQRVSKRLGLCSMGDDVLTIENSLKKIFPKDRWNKLHLQLVSFGRGVCHARNPECIACPLNKICKYQKKKLD